MKWEHVYLFKLAKDINVFLCEKQYGPKSPWGVTEQKQQPVPAGAGNG